MFSKADKSKAKSAAPRTVPSLVSSDLEITGNLQTTGEVQLDGKVEGDVACGKLMIGENAIITGHIEADEVVIRGHVTGRVKAKTVQLAKTAKVVGDIWHDSLAIEAGAFLEGNCKRNDAVQSQAPTSAPERQERPAALEAANPRRQDLVAARQASLRKHDRETVAKRATGG